MEQVKLNALPNYDNCLVNLANSVLRKFGAKTIHNTLPMADELLSSDYRNVVVLVLDAMGISILELRLRIPAYDGRCHYFSYERIVSE